MGKLDSRFYSCFLFGCFLNSFYWVIIKEMFIDKDLRWVFLKVVFFIYNF